MRKHTLAFGALAALLAGCQVAQQREPVSAEFRCGNQPVTLNHNAAFILVQPEYVPVCRGDTVRIQITPRVNAREARTVQAPQGNPGDAPWLDRETGNGSDIVIEVPDDAELGTYKYSVVVDGVGMLDPRIGIVR